MAVVAGLIALTLLLVAGMDRFGHRLEHARRILTLVSATILAAMGVGLLAGWFRIATGPRRGRITHSEFNRAIFQRQLPNSSD